MSEFDDVWHKLIGWQDRIDQSRGHCFFGQEYSARQQQLVCPRKHQLHDSVSLSDAMRPYRSCFFKMSSAAVEFTANCSYSGWTSQTRSQGSAYGKKVNYISIRLLKVLAQTGWRSADEENARHEDRVATGGNKRIGRANPFRAGRHQSRDHRPQCRGG